jgi:hypothetical protein
MVIVSISASILLVALLVLTIIKLAQKRDSLTEKQKKDVRQGMPFLIAITVVCLISIPITMHISEKKDQQVLWTFMPNSAANLSNETVKQILTSFENQCVGLKKYPDAVESVTVCVNKYDPSMIPTPRQEQLGWKNEIEITIKIKDNANTAWPQINGHTLYYYLGGIDSPGIVTMKNESGMFLGIAEKDLSDGNFIRADAFKKVDEI